MRAFAANKEMAASAAKLQAGGSRAHNVLNVAFKNVDDKSGGLSDAAFLTVLMQRCSSEQRSNA